DRTRRGTGTRDSGGGYRRKPALHELGHPARFAGGADQVFADAERAHALFVEKALAVIIRCHPAIADMLVVQHALGVIRALPREDDSVMLLARAWKKRGDANEAQRRRIERDRYLFLCLPPRRLEGRLAELNVSAGDEPSPSGVTAGPLEDEDF